MKLEVFYCRDMLDPVNWLICSATKGRYSHCGLLFSGTHDEMDALVTQYATAALCEVYADPNGQVRLYWESTIGRDERTRHDGMRGPYNVDRLFAWTVRPKDTWWYELCRHWEPWRLELQAVPFLTPEEIKGAFVAACQSVGPIRYARLQLWNNWLRCRLHLALANASRTRWTCSEAVVRLIHAGSREKAAQVFSLGDLRFDDYVPDGRRGPGVYEAIRDAQRKERET